MYKTNYYRDLRSFCNVENLSPQNHTNGLNYKNTLDNVFLFPNQFAYIIHYKHPRIAAYRNTEKVLGYDNFTIEKACGMVHESDWPHLLQYFKLGFRWVRENSIQPNDHVYELYYRIYSRTNRLLHVNRKTMILEVDQENNIASTLSIVTDISKTMEYDQVKAAMYGPQSEKLIFAPMSPLPTVLSCREKEILQLIAEGHNSRQIGEKLFISKHTVDGHRRRMLEKTQCKNTADLILWAYRKGMLVGD